MCTLPVGMFLLSIYTYLHDPARRSARQAPPGRGGGATRFAVPFGRALRGGLVRSGGTSSMKHNWVHAPSRGAAVCGTEYITEYTADVQEQSEKKTHSHSLMEQL